MKAKKIAKRSRPRKPGLREPNGRLQRAPRPEREDEIMSVVIAQRAKVMPSGTNRQALRDQRAETAFGRLLLTGAITPAQYDAGVLWRDSFMAYCRVTGVPLPKLLSTLAETVKGHDERDIPDNAVAAIRERDTLIEAALLDDPRSYRAAKAALNAVIINDKPPGMEMLGDLREALNRIHRACIAGRARRG